MNSKEISNADLLDIVFEGRNKLYGAYALRRSYESRLGLALVGSAAFVFLFLFLIKRASDKIISREELPEIVLSRMVNLPKPEVPVTPVVPRKKVPVKSVPFTNNIVLEPNVPSTVASIESLENASVGTQSLDGNFSEEAVPIEPKPTEPFAAKMQEAVAAPLSSAPAFPGGEEAWISFLLKHLRQPEELEAGERRTVLVRFLVDELGVVSHFEILKSAGAGLDTEVIRVLKKMPKWKPAVQNGKNISVTFVQPVTFQAAEE